MPRPIETGLYVGKVVAASSTEPGRDHTYSVFVDALEYTFENVAPTARRRYSTISMDIDLIPFEVGEDVVVVIREGPDTRLVKIHDAELPAIGAC